MTITLDLSARVLLGIWVVVTCINQPGAGLPRWVNITAAVMGIIGSALVFLGGIG